MSNKVSIIMNTEERMFPSVCLTEQILNVMCMYNSPYSSLLYCDSAVTFCLLPHHHQHHYHYIALSSARSRGGCYYGECEGHLGLDQVLQTTPYSLEPSLYSLLYVLYYILYTSISCE